LSIWIENPCNSGVGSGVGCLSRSGGGAPVLLRFSVSGDSVLSHFGKEGSRLFDFTKA